ncbi:MAG: hypothetical protein JSV52_03010 [Candidatus Zixiibacteriota bacterium]|nr:MAG: hypothetical protein JSV52_03010 [candidate division Zixibacteria bacterium]
MFNKPIQRIEDITFDDRAVGLLALVSMYQVMRFLIFQVPIIISSGFLQMLGENGIIDKDTANALSAAVFIVLEFTLMAVLIAKGKRSFLEQMTTVLSNKGSGEQAPEGCHSVPFTEKQLEIALAIAAGIGIAWCLVLGVNSMALRVFLGIVETFAFVFLITFMTIRFLATREVRRTAVYCLILTTLSLWLIGWGG